MSPWVRPCIIGQDKCKIVNIFLPSTQFNMCFGCLEPSHWETQCLHRVFTVCLRFIKTKIRISPTSQNWKVAHPGLESTLFNPDFA